MTLRQRYALEHYRLPPRMHIRRERSSRCSSSTLRHYPPTDLPRGEGSAAARARTNDVALPRCPTVSRRGSARATLTVELTYSELIEGTTPQFPSKGSCELTGAAVAA